MRIKLIILLFVLLFCIKNSFPQSFSDFKGKFGEPPGFSPSFSITDKIWMWAYFGKDEQVCQAILYTKPTDSQELSEKISFESFTAVVDKIVPPDQRGSMKEPFPGNGVWIASGWSGSTTLTYEKVTLIYTQRHKYPSNFGLNSFNSGRRNKKSSSEPQPNITAEKAENQQGSEDDFIDYKSSMIDSVQIIWNDRKCSEN